MLKTCLQKRYTLSRILRKYNDRQTYLGWDSQRCIQVVIKILPFSYGFDWDNLKHFERETNFLKQLSHPALPEYLDGFEIDQPDFKGFAWVQKYIPAKSLADHLEQGRTFSEEDIKHIASSLLEVLTFLHQRNPAIVHRDVKPSNILLGDRTGHTCGKVYLIDFGAIQTGSSLPEGTITVSGTFGYGAPEQFRGEAIPASDLYGLGMTLIHLITGHNPARLPVRNGRVLFESQHLSAHFKSWITGLTQTDVHKRFQAAGAALAALNQENFELSQLAPRLQQPPNSTLKVYKTSDSFSCTIAPTGFPWGKLFSLLLTVGFEMFFVWVLFIPIIGWYVGYKMLAGILAQIKTILLDTFAHSYFKVTSHEISWVRQWGFLKQDQQTISTNVNKLEQVLPQVVIQKTSDSREVKHFPPALHIHANNRMLKLTAPAQASNHRSNNIHGFTLSELEWLALELSDWFDVPLEKHVLPIAIETSLSKSSALYGAE
ncbi:MAG: serine/threonine-protein kinase [Cyanobacteria bacterium J06560_5]